MNRGKNEKGWMERKIKNGAQVADWLSSLKAIRRDKGNEWAGFIGDE